MLPPQIPPVSANPSCASLPLPSLSVMPLNLQHLFESLVGAYSFIKINKGYPFFRIQISIAFLTGYGAKCLKQTEKGILDY